MRRVCAEYTGSSNHLSPDSHPSHYFFTPTPLSRVFSEEEWTSAGMDSTAFAAQELKASLEGLAKHLFGDVECRWLDTYFPFTGVFHGAVGGGSGMAGDMLVSVHGVKLRPHQINSCVLRSSYPRNRTLL